MFDGYLSSFCCGSPLLSSPVVANDKRMYINKTITMKKLVAISAFLLTALAGHAQQALWGAAPVVSPEIHPDHTVTFRLKAPKARQVQLMGDFLPTKAIKTERGEFDVAMPVDMVEKEGVWEWTTPEPLKPELYSYNLLIDGVKVNDPSNVYMIRDVASVFSVFIVEGERADLYKVNEVPRPEDEPPPHGLYTGRLRKGRQVPRVLPAPRCRWRRGGLD